MGIEFTKRQAQSGQQACKGRGQTLRSPEHCKLGRITGYSSVHCQKPFGSSRECCEEKTIVSHDKFCTVHCGHLDNICRNQSCRAAFII